MVDGPLLMTLVFRGTNVTLPDTKAFVPHFCRDRHRFSDVDPRGKRPLPQDAVC